MSLRGRLLFLFCGSFISGAAAFANTSFSLDQAVPRLFSAQTSPDFVFIGDDHKNPHLASAVNDLIVSLADQRTNCFFIELPSDLGWRLNQAAIHQDMQGFSRTIVEYKKASTARAYQRIKTTPEEDAAVRNYLTNPSLKLSPNFYVNQETLRILSERSIALIAFDAESMSNELTESIYYSVIMNTPRPAKRADIIAAAKAANVRNHIMARNILSHYRAYQCQRGLVVVGYGHLFTEKHFNASYQTNLKLDSLPDLLARDNYKSVVLIPQAVVFSRDTKIDFNNLDKSKFTDFVGSLIVPPRG